MVLNLFQDCKDKLNRLFNIALISQAAWAMEIAHGHGNNRSPAPFSRNLQGCGVGAPGFLNRNLIRNTALFGKFGYEKAESPVGYKIPVGKPYLRALSHFSHVPMSRNSRKVVGYSAFKRNHNIRFVHGYDHPCPSQSDFFLNRSGNI